MVAGGGTGAGCGACFAKPDPLGPGGDDVVVAEEMASTDEEEWGDTNDGVRM